MALAGEWHGAGFSFVLWGIYHGCALAVERAFVFGTRSIPKRVRLRSLKQGVTGIVNIVAVFLLVSFGWVLFRADSIGSALSFFEGLFSTSGWTLQSGTALWLLGGYGALTLIDLAQYVRRDEWPLRSLPLVARSMIVGAVLVHCFLYGGESASVPFIYSQF